MPQSVEKRPRGSELKIRRLTAKEVTRVATLLQASIENLRARVEELERRNPPRRPRGRPRKEEPVEE